MSENLTKKYDFKIIFHINKKKKLRFNLIRNNTLRFLVILPKLHLVLQVVNIEIFQICCCTTTNIFNFVSSIIYAVIIKWFIIGTCITSNSY